MGLGRSAVQLGMKVAHSSAGSAHNLCVTHLEGGTFHMNSHEQSAPADVLAIFVRSGGNLLSHGRGKQGLAVHCFVVCAALWGPPALSPGLCVAS